MAGGVYNSGNSSYYLYTNQYYWAGSPILFYVGYGAGGFRVGDGGFLYGGFVYNSSEVRGVVSLSSESKLLGSGTYNDVYIVE